MKSRKLLLIVSLVLALTMSLGGTLAYLTDTDDAVNVMTLGNVQIKQLENGEVGFDQNQPLYPAYYADSWEGNDVVGAIEKRVNVENTGSSDAYVRTLFAFEAGNMVDKTEFEQYIHTVFETQPVEWLNEKISVAGVNYFVATVTYPVALEKGGETAYSLTKVVMDKTATNETVSQFGGTYEILVRSQACQTINMPTVAADALNAAFGPVNVENATKWFGEVLGGNTPDPVPGVTDSRATYNGKTYENIHEAVAAANANNGGVITLLGSAKLDKNVDIKADITINGNGNALYRDGEYTGTMFTVNAGATLTTENVTLDGAGATATGNLIAAAGNGNIVLNKGTVLQNNNGDHAVDLGTRIGATLTLNGAEIINNSSDSGAIWGGGHITINEGSKINNNSSTGSAGAIRMVGECNLTMNGGEICNNTAAADGGAIWGYGVNGNTSVYNLNGGKISGNTAGGVGGGIYTGTYSTVNISGDFEMCNNTAADSGAMRLTNYTILNMTGGKIAGNISTNNAAHNGFYGWCPRMTLSGGELADNIYIAGGHTPTIGATKITGVVYFDVGTNHNTINLTADFEGFKFKTNETAANFSNFNFKPAAGYTYTSGDEGKLVCMNGGYTTYWDETTGTFRLKFEPIKVDSTNDLKNAIANAEDGAYIQLNGSIDVGTNQLALDKAVILDLNNNVLTTGNNYGGMTLKNGASIKNGTINHPGNTCAIKVGENAGSIENVTINVTPTDGKVKTGIQVYNGKYVESIKHVKITGVTQGIEVAKGSRVDLIEDVEVVAVPEGDNKGVALLVNAASVGKAKDCVFSGDYGVHMMLNGEFQVALELEDCTVTGSTAALYAHDEAGISNTTNCSLTLTYDEKTVFSGDFVWNFEDECLGVVTLNTPN